MNRVYSIIVAIAIISVCIAVPLSPLAAPNEDRPDRPIVQRTLVRPGELDIPVSRQPEAAGASSDVDTFLLVYFDFEPMDWQGWTTRDNTSPHGSLYEYAQLWHVEDFLEPAFAGRAAPLEGTRSMWCGALPAGDEFMCNWESAPGYGNDWNQTLSAYYIKRCSPFEVSFLLKTDIEDGKDFLYLEAEVFDGNFEEAARFTGQIDSTFTVTIPGAHYTKLRFRFETDGSGSDEDGLYTSSCSVTLDSIYLHSLGGELDHFEDFESYDDGDVYTGLWDCNYPDTYGSYAGLWNNIISKDPCGINFGSQVMFFQGSSWPSGAYPGLFDTPQCHPWHDMAYPCQDEMVVSPPIDISRYSTAGDRYQDSDIPSEDLPLLGGAQLRFTVYRDLPLDNLVFYEWHVRGIVDGCPGDWQDRGFVYHGDEPEYFFSVEEIGDLIDADTIQVALGVVDLCKDFFEIREDCETHTPAPWFDNVSIVRYK
ncbi:MAG TPA: hypothetical protein VLA34_05350, partial [Candidatus Krumholzibacterium sp.]|nr:hypothetical protein [Candidatus Krumholzibacterium sp.]